ncbi:MAG TPA: glycosyl hydrolase family 28-related protein, partial [Planctomycetota bacterium]|nr:glycosyl hydrolase family 28-related protein [Planctomycetota bacterium]
MRPCLSFLVLWLAGAAPADNPPASAGSIAPIAASASGSEASSPSMAIDGSGLRELPSKPGVFAHTSNRWVESGSMWAAKAAGAWLSLDLGRSASVTGLHIWNYNEAGGWQNRSVRNFDLLSSVDGKAWQPVGSYTLRCAMGTDDEPGERLNLPKAVLARYLKIVPTSTYGRDNQVGLAEIRLYVSDPKPGDRVLRPRPPFKSRYAATKYAPRPLGKPFPGSENIAWPPGAMIDVSQEPYLAKGDGVSDDTAAINRALAEHADQGAILFLPNGVYRITDTLRWGRGEKFTTLMGQSEKGTVLKLDDHVTGFDSPGKPKPVIWTGGDPAQRFGNEIAYLTVDTGSGNPGCSGVAFVANNQGAIHHATIVSGDGQGLSGLNLGAAVENGPLLARSVTVVGFDVGVTASSAINGLVLEDLTLRDQNLTGIRSYGQHLSLRKVTSQNEVPSLLIKGGVTVLLDSVLTGTGTASGIPAISGSGTYYLRNVTTTGYAQALEDHPGPKIDELASREVASCFPGPGKALHLPVKELPPIPWEAPGNWASPLQFGGKPDVQGDQSPAIQRAIDSGATTVWLPRGLWRIGTPLVLRGKLRRLVGCRAVLETLDGKQRSEPLLKVEEGAGPVEIER